MEDSPSFNLGLTQLDTNAVVGFISRVFDYEKPNFVENISKFRNDPNKMKEIRKAAAEKSKKTIEKSSRLSKKDDSGRPRLPKVVEIKVKYEKFMAGMFSKLVYNNIRPTDEEVQSLDLQMIEGFQLKEAESFEEFSTVPPTEILKKAGLITDASTSHPTKKRKTVCFDSTTAEEKVCQKTPTFVSTRTVPTQKIISSGSEHVHAEKTTPSSSFKSVCQDNSDEKWDDIKLFLQSYDVEGCSEDNATAILDALVESVLNHNSDNTNVETSITVHVYNDHMDVEGVSADFGPATLECLVAAIENQKPNNDNVGTSNMQLPLDFSDAVVTAYQAAKIPSKIVKRIRTRSKVFKSPYTTKYASGSKAIGDQIEKQKQQFTFDGFLISDTMSSSIIEEFKQWVEEGLLKFHAKKDCGVFVAGYAEYLSEEMNVPSDDFEAEYHRMRYATLLRKYDIQKAKKGYVSENDDPP
ncbi:hypothetical protein BC332_04611 [Capsicum chinense]|nr:hypothetical protein BC332_04611 [Capsicum chinense]